jgi:hypothetical protein
VLFGVLQSIGRVFGLKRGQDARSALPLHELNPTNNALNCGTEASRRAPSDQSDSLYLLLCYNEGRYATRLLQLDLITQKAGCDRTLFKVLRTNYTEMRGKWLSFFSFRVLRSIKFVQFDLYKSELVDVKKEDDIPPPGNVEYRYQPAPPELIPPIGERHLMHLFEHPDHAEDEPICFDRFPKKLKEKLICSRGINPGWGLQFVEGWDMKKIWAAIFAMFGIGSLFIGVLWTVYKHSIQDAFTMASYAVAMAAVSVGTLQAFLAT